MKSILVPVSGGEADRSAFEMALGVARLLKAHLTFLHVRQSASAAAVHIPHMGYAVGSLRNALDDLKRQIERRRVAAGATCRSFAHGKALPWLRSLCSKPSRPNGEKKAAMQCSD